MFPLVQLCLAQCLTQRGCVMSICRVDDCVSECILGGTSVVDLAGEASSTQDWDFCFT